MRRALLAGLLLVCGCLRASAPEAFACQTQSDCTSGEKCISEEGRSVCRPLDYCQLDQECSTGQACVERRCVTVECNQFDQSGCRPYGCNFASHTCAQSCAEVACQGGFLCEKTQCVPQECSVSKDCEPFACMGGRCRESCSNASDCALGFECRDGACVVRKLAQGASCAQDQECTSGICCPTARVDQRECSTRCGLSQLGASCTWDAMCASQMCEAGLCRPCASADCSAALCQGLSCGSVMGADCGSCAGRTWCDGGQCAPACAGIECGSDPHGVDCGTCEGQSYCDLGKCQPACVGVECGLDPHGVDCGQCEGLSYCSFGACLPACVGMECGLDHGVDCDTCEGLSYCSAGSCVPACVGLECGYDLQSGLTCGTCDTGEACDQGTCVQAICPPNQYYCEGDYLRYCTDGLAITEVSYCHTGDWDYCEDGQAGCSLYLCAQAGERFCNANVLSVCSDDRKSVLPGGEDCAARGLDCTRFGCGTQTTNTVGGTSVHYISGTAAVGNIYRADTSTILSTFAQSFSVDEATSTRWFVYEATARSGPYAQLASVTSPTSVGFVVRHSPALDVMLVAGRYYLIGVEPTVPFVTYDFLTSSSGAPEATSFGEVLGGYYAPNGLPTTVMADDSFGTFSQYMYTFTLAP